MLKLNKVKSSIYCDPTSYPKMSNTSSIYHTIANAECTGVFCQQVYDAYSYRYNVPGSLALRIGIMGDYHLFVRSGDKVYIEVRKVGEIVISFAELQKNRYWKYYYDLSLMLANDKHKVIHNSSFNKLYDEIYEYTGNRKWSLDTSFIDLDIDQNYKKTYKIIPSGNVCYYKINPFDLEGMEYSTVQGIDLFKRTYMSRSDVKLGYFLNRSEIYKNIALEYNVMKMEEELDELSEFFDNKKNIFTLSAIQKEHLIDNDVLMIIYENLVGNDKSDIANMIAKIDRAREAKTALELIAHIIAI